MPSIAPTPTYIPWFYPTPTPIVFQTNWTLAYTALVIDNPKDPVNDYHLEIHTIQLNEKYPVKVAQILKSSWKPRWSSDGKRLAFISFVGDKSSLYVLTLETGQMDEITDASDFAWSPDGQQIVYCEEALFRQPPYHCYLSESDNPAQSRRLLTTGDWYPVRLEWSPKGDQIMALVDREVGPRMIYMISLDGQIEQIPTQKKIWGHVSWHPGGEKIAYDVYVDDYDVKSEARVIDLLTMEEKELTHSGMIVFYPVWSPDGKYLAYEATPPLRVYVLGAKVYILNLDTGKSILASKVGGGYFPSWSPDGDYLAYLQGGIADYGENASLHVFELDTGIAVTILPEGADWFSVAWKPMP